MTFFSIKSSKPSNDKISLSPHLAGVISSLCGWLANKSLPSDIFNSWPSCKFQTFWLHWCFIHLPTTPRWGSTAEPASWNCSLTLQVFNIPLWPPSPLPVLFSHCSLLLATAIWMPSPSASRGLPLWPQVSPMPSRVTVQGNPYNKHLLVGSRFSTGSAGFQRWGTDISQACAHVFPLSLLPRILSALWRQPALMFRTRPQCLVGGWWWQSPLETWIAFQGQHSSPSPFPYKNSCSSVCSPYLLSPQAGESRWSGGLCLGPWFLFVSSPSLVHDGTTWTSPQLGSLSRTKECVPGLLVSFTAHRRGPLSVSIFGGLLALAVHLTLN